MNRIFIAGDSTAAAKLAEKRPETGWGEMLPHFLSPAYQVINQAVNGRSTKSFIEEGRLQEIADALQPGDYLLIQFGHNDQKSDERGTQPYHDYQTNLAEYAAVAQQHGATPILLTSITRRDYLPGTKQLNPAALGDYPAAMKAFAAENNVLFLDIFTESQSFLNKFSRAETRQFFLQLPAAASENYPEGVHDNTHLNSEGAYQIAALIATALKGLPIPLAEEISLEGWTP